MTRTSWYFGAFVLLATVADLTAQQGTSERPVLSWGVQVENAEPLLFQPLRARVYSEPAQMRLRLTIVNEGIAAITVDQLAFQQAVRTSVSNTATGQAIPVEVDWLNVRLRSSEDAPMIEVGPGEPRLVVASQGGAVWTIGVRPIADDRFETGDYTLTVSMANVMAIRTEADEVWNGRYVPETRLSVSIKAPTTSQERAAMAQVSARGAVDRGDFVDAVSFLRSANKEDPDNLSVLSDLGQVYMLLNRHREAVAVYERLVPRLARRNEAASMLALAYLSLDDEANAARALRASGLSESGQRAELSKLRDAVQRNRRR